MIVENLSEPFFHTIVHDFYTTEEEKLIWQELDYLDLPNKSLLESSETGDPSAVNRSRVFLDAFYRYRNFSKILEINRKIFSTEFTDLIKSNPFSNYLIHSNMDNTLLSYYKNKSFYPLHKDESVISIIITFWRNPKKFVGGNLTFDEYYYTPKMNHNSLILFPSFVKHSVNETFIDNENEIVGNSRYSISSFYKIHKN
jgi:hypothetical protein